MGALVLEKRKNSLFGGSRCGINSAEIGYFEKGGGFTANFFDKRLAAEPGKSLIGMSRFKIQFLLEFFRG